jgi:hypothetical protein
VPIKKLLIFFRKLVKSEIMAPSKKSPIWDYFEEEKMIQPMYFVKLVDAKLGVQEESRELPEQVCLMHQWAATLNFTTQRKMLKWWRRKLESGEKRKQSEEENEMEGGTVPLFNLRTSRQRQEFLVQSKVSSWVTGGGATKADHTYDILTK